VEIRDLFQGSFLNAVDAKGRVSLPSPFRAKIAARSKKAVLAGDEANEQKLMVGRHERFPALEAYDDAFSIEMLNRIKARVDALPDDIDKYQAFEDMQSDAFGATSEISFDDAGRMVLPASVRDPAGIDGLAFFVGAGSTIQIWDPKRFLETRSTESPRVADVLRSILKDKKITL
jgi:MraZ protein